MATPGDKGVAKPTESSSPSAAIELLNRSVPQPSPINQKAYCIMPPFPFLARFLSVAALALVGSIAAAQPIAGGKTLTIVVPVPAGAGPDLVARTIGEKIAARLGQSVVVDNRPGAGTLVGAAFVARGNADGASVLLAPNTLVISPHVLPKGAGGGLDVLKELKPVVPIATTPILLVANPNAGVRNIEQLRAATRQRGSLSYGSAGNGTPMHFAGVLLQNSAKVDLVHVPYRGVAPSITGVLAGEVPLAFVGLGGVAAHIKSGKLAAVALAERARSGLLPDVPTLAESGVQGVEVNAWYGLFVAAGAPAGAVVRWNEEINAVLKMPDVRAKLEAAGVEVTGGSAEQLGATARIDHDRYGRLARDHQVIAD